MNKVDVENVVRHKYMELVTPKSKCFGNALTDKCTDSYG